MRFEKLNEVLPYVTGGKQKILSYQPYNAISLRFPGRHASDTDPVGGDFVVCVDDENTDWVSHQFTHVDLFVDVETKALVDREATDALMRDYLMIVKDGEDPKKLDSPEIDDAGIHVVTFKYAVQCLAVAEHRRYHRFEPKFGGRFLPFRFVAGIAEGLWGSSDATGMSRRGRPGCEILEKIHGTPVLTKELMT